MKMKIVAVVCLLVAFSVPAFAGENFVDRFLAHYKPLMPAAAKATPSEVAPDALTSLIKSGEIPMSINDVVTLTLKNNLSIGLDRLTPLSTRIAIDSFYRPFDPTLHLSSSVNRSSTPSSSQLSGAPSVSQLSQSYDVGFGQYLQTGTQVGVDFALNRSSSNSAFSTFNPAWSGNVKYSATQHLLKDYGRVINARQFKIAKNNVDISDIQFERQVIDLITQAEKSYWDLVFTFEDLKVKQRSMDLAQKTLSDNRIQVDAGALATADLVQAETEVANRQLQLLDSNFSQVQVSDQIKKLVTNGPDPGLVLAKISPTQMAPRPKADDVLPAADAIKLALANRPEIRQLDIQMKNHDIDLQYTKNQLLPSLDVNASYTQQGIGGTETLRSGFGSGAPIISVTPGGVFDALGQIVRQDFTGYSVGFNLQIPLSNRAAQSDHARALLDKRTEENRKADTSQSIALEVRNAITSVQMTSARYEAAQKVRELSVQKLQYEQRKFDLGASTIRFVIEEQRNVTQAETDEVAALINYAKALVDYDRAIGVTLKKNNIVLDKN